MEALKKLNEDLGAPSAAKLLAAARKKGLQITKADVNEVKDSVRQLFAKPLPQKGAIATNEDSGVWQADLAECSRSH